MAAAVEADVVVMAAAVADFRPADVAADKIKKDESADGTPEPLVLVRNPDILAGLVEARAAGALPRGTVLVGFAAETGDSPRAIRSPTPGPSWPARAWTCSCSTTCRVGRSSAAPTTRSTCSPRTGPSTARTRGTKAEVAHAVWDRVVGLRADSA